MSLDVMKQALEALEEIADEVFSPYDNKLGDAILALRAAIKQVQEPVVLNGGRLTQYPDGSIGVGTPAKPDQWQGLTDDEIALICGECAASHADDISYARAIEAKLKAKNS